MFGSKNIFNTLLQNPSIKNGLLSVSTFFLNNKKKIVFLAASIIALGINRKVIKDKQAILDLKKELETFKTNYLTLDDEKNILKTEVEKLTQTNTSLNNDKNLLNAALENIKKKNDQNFKEKSSQTDTNDELQEGEKLQEKYLAYSIEKRLTIKELIDSKRIYERENQTLLESQKQIYSYIEFFSSLKKEEKGKALVFILKNIISLYRDAAENIKIQNNNKLDATGLWDFMILFNFMIKQILTILANFQTMSNNKDITEIFKDIFENIDNAYKDFHTRKPGSDQAYTQLYDERPASSIRSDASLLDFVKRDVIIIGEKKIPQGLSHRCEKNVVGSWNAIWKTDKNLFNSIKKLRCQNTEIPKFTEEYWPSDNFTNDNFKTLKDKSEYVKDGELEKDFKAYCDKIIYDVCLNIIINVKAQ